MISCNDNCKYLDKNNCICNNTGDSLIFYKCDCKDMKSGKSVGVYTDNVMERYWGEDPRTVVIDEFFGTWVATLSALFCFGSWHEAVAYAILSFSLFRIIDIFKPLGCRWIDKNVHGGLGCMLDDLLAGFYAIIITFVVRMVVGYFG